MKLWRTVWCWVFLSFPLLAQRYRIETVAGMDHAKEGPGLTVLLRTPSDIVAGRNGVFYVSDKDDHRVRRIGPDFAMTTLAGDGHCCFGGDDGAAAQARIGYPHGLAFDATRNRLYIAQPLLGRIRAVDIDTGKISTFAGTGQLEYKVANENRLATMASISPNYIAVDELGNLFVSDDKNYRIYRIDAATRTIRTVAGTGIQQVLFDPKVGEEVAGLTVSIDPVQLAASQNRVVFMDGFNLRGLDLNTGLTHTIVRNTSSVGGIQISSTNIYGKPVFSGTSILTPLTLYLEIHRFSFEDRLTITLLWNPPLVYDASAGPYKDPIRAFALNGSTLLTIGMGQLVSRLVGKQQVPVAGFGPPQASSPPLGSYLMNPRGLLLKPNGELVIADTGNARLRVLDVSQRILRIPKSSRPHENFTETSRFGRYSPGGLSSAANGEVFFTDVEKHNVKALSADEGEVGQLAGGSTLPGFRGDGGNPLSARFSSPDGIVALPDGSILVADSGNNRIRRISADGGQITTVAGNGTVAYVAGAAPLATGMSPSDLAVGPDGLVYIADPINNRVYRFDQVRRTIESIAGTGVEGFSGDGGLATQARLFYPSGVAVSRRGEVFIADEVNNRIRRISPGGIIRTIAGNGRWAAMGDGGAALDAALSPVRMQIAPDDSIYFSDSDHHQVRRLILTSAAGPTPAIAAGGVVSLASGGRRAAPGSLVSIYGSNLAGAPVAAGSFPLPRSIGGVQVWLNGIALPLLYVSAGQINAQVPSDLPPGRANIEVLRDDERSNTQTIDVVGAQPDILSYGGSRAVALNESGALNGPDTPASPGEYVVVFLTGIGVTNPVVATGAASPVIPLARATGVISATIAGEEAEVAFLGLTPGYAGLAQANIRVPASAPAGDQELILRVRGVESNRVKITVLHQNK